MNIIREIWICRDCMLLHETGDATFFDHDYDTGQRDEDGLTEADRRLAEVEQALDLLPGLVSDNTENDGDEIECHDCGHIDAAECFPVSYTTDDDLYEEEHVNCPKCNSKDCEERDSGRREFTWAGCDCCDSTLGGSLYRYAQLVPELAVPEAGDAVPTSAALQGTNQG